MSNLRGCCLKPLHCGVLYETARKTDTAPNEAHEIFFLVLLQSKPNGLLWIVHSDEFIASWESIHKPTGEM